MENRCKMEIFSWGANSYGQLGLGSLEDHLLPQKSTLFLESCSTPTIITGGGGHTVVLTDSGVLFVCGLNDCGQLGTGNTESLKIFQKLNWTSKIKYVACGWNHTLFLSDSGECFSFGSNAFFQLGNSKNKIELHPVRVQGMQGNVKVIAAGMRHSVALTEDGSVYCWGCGKKGQLGLEEGLGAHIKSPRKVVFSEGVIIKDIKAGAEFTAALSVDGDVFCWGSNVHGQCGLPGGRASTGSCLERTNKVLKPTKIKLTDKILKIHAGWSHMLALTESGILYAWGRGDYGQLGKADCESKHEANEVFFENKTISALSGGSEHNMVITDDFQLFVWGWNEHGMCATGDEENVRKPHHVTFFDDKKPILVGCGAGTSFVCVYLSKPCT